MSCLQYAAGLRPSAAYYHYLAPGPNVTRPPKKSAFCLVRCQMRPTLRGLPKAAKK
jgi:hypothetical protein